MLLFPRILLLFIFFLVAARVHGSTTTTVDGEEPEEGESTGSEDSSYSKERHKNSSHTSDPYVDYYSILGLEPGENDMFTIKGAYRAMALKWHPDKVDHDKKSHSEAMLMQINEAYETLSDYDRRNEYLNTYQRRESATELMTRTSTALQSLLKLSKKMWEDLPPSDRQEFVYELKQYLSNKEDIQHDATLIFNNKHVLRGFFRASVLAVTVIGGFALLGAALFSFHILKTTNEVTVFLFKVVTFPFRIFNFGGRSRSVNQDTGQQIGGGRENGGGWGRQR